MLTADGAEPWFDVRGAGPDVLFVQGVGVTSQAWSPQIDELSRDHRCIALDHRGIGKSTGDSSALSVDSMARDALAVLDELHVERAHLVGHSLGGVIIQRLALLAPERVASLALLCTFAGGQDLAKPSARSLWLGARSRVGTRRMRRKAFARLIMPDAYLREHGEERVMSELERVLGRPLWDAPKIGDLQLRALPAHDERAELSKLKSIRSVVLSGRHDPIATAAANAALADAIGANHHEWDDASHALPIQYPAAVNAVLRAHFAGTTA
jgi:pimeloyl-ACP methyl ester carboxylesterase